MSERIVYFGSRDWWDEETIRKQIVRDKKKYGTFLAISGECRGADTLSKKISMSLGLPYCGFPANWSFYKPQDKKMKNPAGPIRNGHMIEYGLPTRGVCFHNDLSKSKGSKDMLERLKEANIPVKIVKGLPDDD